jgi:two-component system, cell cycle sensor histidine kinase and response regulator CckA
MRPSRAAHRPALAPGELHRALVNVTGELIFTVDVRGRLTFVNPAVTDRLQYAATDLLGQPALDLVRADRRAEARAFYRRQMARDLARSYYELPVLARHGGTVWLGLQLRRLDGADGRTLVGSAQDITERMRLESALRESEDRYRQAFDENLAGVYVVSPAGQVRNCNPAFVRIHGFPSMMDAIGANLGTLYPEGYFARLIERVRQDGALHHHETTIRRVDGATLHIIESLVGRFDQTHTLTAVNGYVFDDTPRRELQAEIRQTQKMEALGRLAGGVAHDFNNILMVMNGLSETALEIIEGDHPVRQDLVEILEAGRRGAALTAQLLSFGRARMLQAVAFDLDEAIADMKPMLRRLLGSDVTLEIEASPDPKWIVADRSRIEQVLLNLAINGRDAMPQGGRLRLETRVVDRPHEFGLDTIALPEVVLRLTDSGEGMTPDVQARLFEPYFTTKARGKGTGLGLSTVYAIVTESGGSIRVDTAPGRGATFTIALPLAGAPDVASPDAIHDLGIEAGDRLHPSNRDQTGTVDGSADANLRTVLVVEDERSVRQIVTNALRRAGYRVLATADPAAALMLLREHGATLDLLLTDVIMPGMNGRELARDAHVLFPSLPVLFMSGFADRAFGPEGPAAAGGAFLQKPFTLDTLLAKVRAMVSA